MRGQALVPLTGPLLRDGTHEVPLKLTDAGVMLEHILVRLVEILRGGKSRGEKRSGEEGGCSKGGGRNFHRTMWIKKIIRGGKVRSGDGESLMGRERKGEGYVHSWERLTNGRE